MAIHTAIRTPADLAGSGWYELLPKPAPPRVLEGKRTADWVVIGGGFAGMAAARRLTQLQPGSRIVVLDAQRIGWGAAGRNSGFMIDLPHELASDNYAGGRDHDIKQIRMNRAAIEFAAGAAAEYGLEPHFIRAGKYHGAATARGQRVLAEFEQHLSSLGEPFEKLSADDLRRVTGTSYYAGGTFTPGTVMIQPAAYIRGVAHGLAEKVEIFENSPVVSIRSGTTHAVSTPQGEVEAPRIILTVNGQVESFGFFRRRLMHIFLYASMSQKLTSAQIAKLGGENYWGLIPADPLGSTVRRFGDRIVVRNSCTYNPAMQVSDGLVKNFGKAHDRSFDERFPMLPGVQAEFRWAGHLCLSLNSAPAFGEVEQGIYSACCCNGLGTVKGTLYGKLSADLAAGSGEMMVEEALSGPVPRKLYPEPFMSLGATAKLWWLQKRAGREM